MADKKLGDIYYNIGFKGLKNAERDLEQFSKLLQKPFSASASAEGQYANRLLEQFYTRLQDKHEKLQQAMDQRLKKSIKLIATEIESMVAVNPMRGATAIANAQSMGVSPTFQKSLQSAISEILRRQSEAVQGAIQQQLSKAEFVRAAMSPRGISAAPVQPAGLTIQQSRALQSRQGLIPYVHSGESYYQVGRHSPNIQDGEAYRHLGGPQRGMTPYVYSGQYTGPNGPGPTYYNGQFTRGGGITPYIYSGTHYPPPGPPGPNPPPPPPGPPGPNPPPGPPLPPGPPGPNPPPPPGPPGHPGPFYNPWLPTVNPYMGYGAHQLHARYGAAANALSGEIGTQVYSYNSNARLRGALGNVVSEHLTPGSTGADITQRQNELADASERDLHLAERRSAVERQTLGMMAQRVSYAQKIADEEEAAIEVATKKNGGPLTGFQENEVRTAVRANSVAAAVGGDYQATSERLLSNKEKLAKLNDIAATSPVARAEARAIEEENKALERRQVVHDERARLSNEKEQLSQDLKDPTLNYFQRRALRKRIAITDRQMGIAENELDTNQQTLNSTNAGRQAGKMGSRRNNYRMQELSYGAQDFLQVLSGGQGLDSALRSANNNISQFYAAAGGANAARNSLAATVLILGIAAALKHVADQADEPNKKLEEFIAKAKRLQGVRAEVGGIGRGAITAAGDISGANAVGMIADKSKLEFDLKNRRENLSTQVDIFGGRMKPNILNRFATGGNRLLGESLASIPFTDGYFGKEFLSKVGDSKLGKAFHDRFVEKKNISELEDLSSVMQPEQKKLFESIYNSKDTSTESAIKAFKEIDGNGGFKASSAEGEAAIAEFRKTIEELDTQLSKLAASAAAFDYALGEMGSNLDRRNSVMGSRGMQSQMGARGEDVRFINDMNSQARQHDEMAASYWADGKVDLAKQQEAEAADKRRIADVRTRRMGPGGGEFFTDQASAYEGVMSPLAQQRQDALKMRDDATKAKSPHAIAQANFQLNRLTSLADKTSQDYLSSFQFSGRRANESYGELDSRSKDTYDQKVKLANATHGAGTPAAARAIAQLDRARATDQLTKDSQRVFEKDMSAARASGTNFDENRASIEADRNAQLAEAKVKYAGNAQAYKDAAAGINAGANRRLNRNLMDEGRARSQAENGMGSSVFDAVGGKVGQGYQNMSTYKSDLERIQSEREAGNITTDKEADAQRATAKKLFDERQKDIDRAQVGFSDAGSLWKSIQMSLKPDKSLQLQKEMLDAFEKMNAAITDAKGLKVQIPLN